MTRLFKTDTEQTFDIPTDLVVPVDLVNSILTPSGEGAFYLGGGTIEFDLPLTDNNRLLIGEDEYSTIPVRLEQGTRIMVGDLRVLSQNDEAYQVQIDDPVSTLLERLKTVPLTALYWEDLNHVWSFANIVSDRSAGWVYGLEDRGTMRVRPNFFTAPRRRLAPFGTDGDAYNFFPGVFLFEYINRMFDYIGIELDSTLIDNASWFKRLYIPFTGGEIRKAAGVAVGASGVFAGTSNQDYVPFVEEIIEFGSTNNNTNFNTTTHEYTATVNGMATVRLNFGALSNGTNAPSLGFATRIKKNGSVITENLFYTNSSFDTYGETTIDVYLEIGDIITGHFVALAGLLVPRSGTSLEVTIEDRLTVGDTITMRNFVPNIMCADLLKWTMATFNMVPRPSQSQRLVKLEVFDQSFDSGIIPDPIQIDLDSISYTTISDLGRSNFLHYNSGSNYGNGGFRINDSRLDPEVSVLSNGFIPTQMRTWGFSGRMKAMPVLMEDDSVYPFYQKTAAGDDVLYFPGTIPNIGLRLLFMARVSVSDLFNDGTTAIQIGTESPTSVNWPYFYNPINQINTPLSLSFRDEVLYTVDGAQDAEGLNLTEFCFAEYAKDFQRFQQFNALAALSKADFAALRLDALYPVAKMKGLYRIIQVSQFTGKSKSEITMRRVNAFDNSALLTVGEQTGKSSGNTGAPNNGQDNAAPQIPQVVMNRVQIGFGGVSSDRLLFALSDAAFNYPIVGFWGDYVATDQIVIPASGYYQINFQVCGEDEEAGNYEIEMWYEVLDNATDLNVIYERSANNHGASKQEIACNLVNEENLTTGNVIRFYAIFTGGHSLNIDQEHSFATVTQRPETAINNTP
jgi:hypothetical protein